MRATLLVLGLMLGGCATNGVYVEEITADGGSLVVRQQTRSTWGAKTQEGAGNFYYEATDPEGGGFIMEAGAKVKGQEASDPSQGLLSLIGVLKEVGSLLYGPPLPESTQQRARSGMPPEALEGIEPDE